MKTEKTVCASCRKKVDFIIREGEDIAHIKDSNGKTYHIPYIRKYAYCKECGNEVWVQEIDEYNAKTPLNSLYGICCKVLTKFRHFPFEGFDPFKEYHVIIYKRLPVEAFGKIVDACSFDSIEKATEFYEKENHGLSSDMAMKLTYCKIEEK